MQGRQRSLRRLRVIPDRVERRAKQRICTPFPATVLWKGESGGAFRCRTTVDNISAGGLYLRLCRPVPLGRELSITVHLSSPDREEGGAPRWLIRGVVLRVEPKPGGVYGLAVASTHRRLI